ERLGASLILAPGRSWAKLPMYRSVPDAPIGRCPDRSARASFEHRNGIRDVDAVDPYACEVDVICRNAVYVSVVRRERGLSRTTLGALRLGALAHSPQRERHQARLAVRIGDHARRTPAQLVPLVALENAQQERQVLADERHVQVAVA